MTAPLYRGRPIVNDATGRRTIADMVSSALTARNEWLEDVVAGLMINGVRVDEIEIHLWPSNRTVVTVRGVPKYEHTLEPMGPT